MKLHNFALDLTSPGMTDSNTSREDVIAQYIEQTYPSTSADPKVKEAFLRDLIVDMAYQYITAVSELAYINKMHQLQGSARDVNPISSKIPTIADLEDQLSERRRLINCHFDRQAHRLNG